jgi:hypothetical protein
LPDGTSKLTFPTETRSELERKATGSISVAIVQLYVVLFMLILALIGMLVGADATGVLIMAILLSVYTTFFLVGYHRHRTALWILDLKEELSE